MIISRIMVKTSKTLYDTIRNLGKKPICNANPSRAPHIGKFCLPLCWRCTSTIGVLVFLQCLWVFFGSVCVYIPTIKAFAIVGVLVLPMGVDGLAQTVFGKESTNPRRVITGLLAGIGLWVFALWYYCK